MQNVKFVEFEYSSEEKEITAIIENEDGSVTSMLKSTWDEQQAKKDGAK